MTADNWHNKRYIAYIRYVIEHKNEILKVYDKR